VGKDKMIRQLLKFLFLVIFLVSVNQTEAVSSSLKITSYTYWPRSIGPANVDECSQIVIELFNSGDQPQEIAEVYPSPEKGNTTNQVYGFGIPDIEILNPKEKTAFSIILFEKKSCTPMNFKIKSKPVKAPRDTSLKVTSSKLIEFGTNSVILGKVKNTASKVIYSAQVVCILYADKQQEIILDSESGFPNSLANIGSGQVTDFRVHFFDPKHIGKSFSCQTEHRVRKS
jgi:hypothetical protein